MLNVIYNSSVCAVLMVKCTNKAIIKGIYEVEVKYGHNTKLVFGDFYTSHFCFVKSQQDNVDLLSINGN